MVCHDDSTRRALDELSEDFIEQAGFDSSNGKLCEEIPAGSGADALLADVEARFISSTLDRTGGNIAAAAKMMGIGRNTLYRKLRGQAADCP